jgi:regulator of protease activity HflC (stomatin/prohibitin superfamily)
MDAPDQAPAAPVPPVPAAPLQLTQERVPLDRAADAFATEDATGRVPIVVLPTRPSRVRVDLVALAVAILLAGLFAARQTDNSLFSFGAAAVAVAVVVTAVMGAFIVRVPEGTVALLSQGGKYVGQLESGMHRASPRTAVSHLVTRRQVPYDAPLVDAPTSDDVRVGVDALLTFSVVEPYKFVYSISAGDFDRVLQAACLDAIRSVVRSLTWSQVVDLGRTQAAQLRDVLSADVEPYGVAIARVTITYARPPEAFLRSAEARQLSRVEQSEQTERQALALRRQTDLEALSRQEVLARVARDDDEMRIRVQEAEARRRVAEIESDTHVRRLAALEQALREYPQAALFEAQSAQLEVARALAGNTRAVLQVGSASDITRAFVVRDTMQEPASQAGPSSMDSHSLLQQAS